METTATTLLALTQQAPHNYFIGKRKPYRGSTYNSFVIGFSARSEQCLHARSWNCEIDDTRDALLCLIDTCIVLITRVKGKKIERERKEGKLNLFRERKSEREREREKKIEGDRKKLKWLEGIRIKFNLNQPSFIDVARTSRGHVPSKARHLHLTASLSLSTSSHFLTIVLASLRSPSLDAAFASFSLPIHVPTLLFLSCSSARLPPLSLQRSLLSPLATDAPRMSVWKIQTWTRTVRCPRHDL